MIKKKNNVVQFLQQNICHVQEVKMPSNNVLRKI